MPRNAIALILKLHKHDGTEPISKLPGLWQRKLDERWTFWVNGHMMPQSIRGVAHPDSPGVIVQPADCYVEYNGWPAGSFSLVRPETDAVFAAGAAANYETFCDALEAALREAVDVRP